VAGALVGFLKYSDSLLEFVPEYVQKFGVTGARNFIIVRQLLIGLAVVIVGTSTIPVLQNPGTFFGYGLGVYPATWLGRWRRVGLATWSALGIAGAVIGSHFSNNAISCLACQPLTTKNLIGATILTP